MVQRSICVSVKRTDASHVQPQTQRRRILRGTSAPSFTRHTTSASAMNPRNTYSFIIGLIEILIVASGFDTASAVLRV